MGKKNEKSKKDEIGISERRARLIAALLKLHPLRVR